MKNFKNLLNEFTCPPQKNPITLEQLHILQDSLQKYWKALGIEVELGPAHGHFLERLQDPRSQPTISFCEVQKIFIESFKKYGKLISQKHPGYSAVLSDISTKLNIPIMLKIDPKTKALEMVAKTAMRKPNFMTPDPKLTVEQHKNMKTYRQLKEEIFPTPKNSEELKEWLGFQNASGNNATPDAVDDESTAAFAVEQPVVLDQLNAYCHDVLGNQQYINPYNPLNLLWRKLSYVGLNFDPKSLYFTGNQGSVETKLTQFGGGRYGVLGGPEYISQDDGISHRIPGGLSLKVHYQKNGGAYTLDAEIVRNTPDPSENVMEAGNLVKKK